MTASPGIPPARSAPSGRTRDDVITPPPHPLRRSAAATVLSARVIRYARCADSGLDTDQWFPVSVAPDSAPGAAAAIAVCTSCLVRGECLVLALRRWDIGQHGAWGGLATADRARLRRCSQRPGSRVIGGGDMAQAVDRQLVLRAWRTLSLEQRQVLIECYFGGASVAEAAETLGVPASTVKSRTYDALCNLRDVIDSMGGVA